jgi:hypothetical protein
VPATEPSADGSASEPTRTFVAGGDTALGEPADPVIAAPYPATEAGSSGAPHPPTEADSSGARHVPAPSPAAADVVRYGPGVPAAAVADRAELTAERAWRGGAQRDRARRPRWLRLLVSWPLTVILLAASGVVLYLRFHHATMQVTGVTIAQRPQASCGTDVTGRIATNGAAGTVTYQWLVASQTQAPRPLDQSVGSGQHDVQVTLDFQGSGQGSVSQAVTLQVLNPDPASVSATVVISC